MFRNCLTAVLLMGYFACQMAKVPHAHAHQAADHDLRAHMHWDWCGGLRATDEPAITDSHAHSGHEHHSHHRGHSHEHPPVAPTPAVPDSTDHDSTSVYVPYCEHVSVTASPSFSTCGELTTVPAAGDYFTSTAPPPSPAFHAPPEDHLVRGCALILRLRTLRI